MNAADIKKYAVGAALASAITGGAYVAGSALSNCSTYIEHNGERICIEQQVKEAIEGNLKPNAGFGGVKFGGK